EHVDGAAVPRRSRRRWPEPGPAGNTPAASVGPGVPQPLPEHHDAANTRTHRHNRAPLGPADADRGSVTVLAAVLILALIAALAPGVDGAGKLRALNRADAIAAEAGRAALSAVDTRGPAPRLDTPAAVRAANAYLARVGHPGSVTLTGLRTITVTVTLTEPAAIGLFGASYTVTGHASAELGVGVHSGSQ